LNLNRDMNVNDLWIRGLSRRPGTAGADRRPPPNPRRAARSGGGLLMQRRELAFGASRVTTERQA
jgi:hypothetical protein